jgi:hypothetical protein
MQQKVFYFAKNYSTTENSTKEAVGLLVFFFFQKKKQKAVVPLSRSHSVSKNLFYNRKLEIGTNALVFK